MKKVLTLLAAISLVQSFAFSRISGTQTSSEIFRSTLEGERGLVALDQSLRDLTNPFTIACLAAHAEDIDFGTLAYYRKNLGARTVILLATRNESGGH
ncbi:MAG TPA: hypothetical protein VID27_06510, partial [Blastocatellia bacterium]